VSGAPLNGIVKLILESGEFIGIGEINDDGLVAPKRLVV
jgi:tRNA pseudouridine55 synthase